MDNQFEYRFATGPVQHTTLIGVNLRHYAIDDKQGIGTGTDLNVDPVYGVNTPYDGPLYQSGYLTQGQLGVYLQDQINGIASR